MDQLTKTIAQRLTVDMFPDGIWKALAEEIGPYNVIAVLTLIGGGDFYIPKPDRFLIPARNELILEEYTGYNIAEIAQKYGMARKYVQQVLNNL